MKKAFLLPVLLAAFLAVSFPFSRPAFAAKCCLCTNSFCSDLYRDELQDYMNGDFYNDFIIDDLYNNWIVDDLYREKIVGELWLKNIRPALQEMASELTANGTQMTGLRGRFIDAEQQLETQRLLQELQAQSIKDYTPSDPLCRFGTGVRSLAGAETLARTTGIALAELTQDRQLGNRGGNTEIEGMSEQSRLSQFKRVYCDPGDNNGLMNQICEMGGGFSSTPERFNKDIDYTRTIDAHPTLHLAYADGTQTPDEEDVLALSSNLYSYDVFRRIPDSTFTHKDNMDEYLDLRQVVALRSVAQDSFAAITAMRTAGPAGSGDFLEGVLQELGLSPEEAQRYLNAAGGAGEPSYYAQMEILTKKLYQNPNFYAALIDKPTNVKRQQAALQAFSLMQNRDIYESALRSEMLMSVLLELEIRDEQLKADIFAGNAPGVQK